MNPISPTPINRLPLGLLGFLGIKNGGRYPSVLGNTLDPGWDLADLYLQTNAEWIEGLPNAAALGFVAGLTVPQGEFWHVHEIGTYSAVLGAGQSATFAIALLGANGSYTVPLTPTSAVSVVGTRAALGMLVDRIVSPGTQLGLYITQLAAGPLAFSYNARFTRMSA